jgi:hypothetical protein
MAASAAAAEQVQLFRAQGVSAPRPQRYEELRELNPKWATDRGIDWARAVVTSFPFPSPNNPRRPSPRAINSLACSSLDSPRTGYRDGPDG